MEEKYYRYIFRWNILPWFLERDQSLDFIVTVMTQAKVSDQEILRQTMMPPKAPECSSDLLDFYTVKRRGVNEWKKWVVLSCADAGRCDLLDALVLAQYLMDYSWINSSWSQQVQKYFIPPYFDQLSWAQCVSFFDNR